MTSENEKMDDKELRKAWLRQKFTSFDYQEEMLGYHQQALEILLKYWSRDDVKAKYPNEWNTMQKTVLPNLRMVAKPGEMNRADWKPGIDMGWANAISYNFNRGISDLYFDETVCVPEQEAKSYGALVNRVLRMCQNIEYTIQDLWHYEGTDDYILDEEYTGPINWPPNWKEEITSTLNLSPNRSPLSTGGTRSEGGKPCPRSGYWQVWHESGSRRYFKAGEIMPGGQTTQGERVWSWDQDQTTK